MFKLTLDSHLCDFDLTKCTNLRNLKKLPFLFSPYFLAC
jgi:hypothetical protein